MINEKWSIKDEKTLKWLMNNEQWKRNDDYWSMINEQWAMNDEWWFIIND